MTREAVIVFVILMAVSVSGMKIFQYSCGKGCYDTHCSRGIGCQNCQQEYCAFNARYGAVCMLKCPDGYYCNIWNGRRFCKKRRP